MSPPKLALRDPKDPVFDDRTGVQPSLRDEDRLVHPLVPRIPSLEARAGPEVVLVPVARALARVRGKRSLGVLDHAEVLDVDVGAVVRVKREPHVEAAPSVRPDEDPVRAARADRAANAVTPHLARANLADAAGAERARADRHRLRELGGEVELVNELHRQTGSSLPSHSR